MDITIQGTKVSTGLKHEIEILVQSQLIKAYNYHAKFKKRWSISLTNICHCASLVGRFKAGGDMTVCK